MNLEWIDIPELGTRGTALHRACARQDVPALQQACRLVANHVHNAVAASVNALTADGQSPLWILARQSSSTTTPQSFTSCWQLLLQQEATNPNLTWHGQTLLQYLCAINATDVVQLLLQDGRIRIPSFDGSVALCNVGPLDMACRNCNALLVRALAAHGEHFTFKDHGMPIPLRLPLVQGNINTLTSSSSSWSAFVDTLDAFLHVLSIQSREQNVNIQGADGYSIQHLCATWGHNLTQNNETRVRQMMEVLERYHVNFHLPTGKDTQRQTALMQAAYSGHVTMALQLVPRCSNIHAQDAQGRSCIYFAQDIKLVQALLAHGADLEAITAPCGRTPLLEAIRQGQAVHALVQAGANVVARDVHGRTALHYAVAVRRLDVVQALLLQHNHGIMMVHARDAQGRTPLHWLGLSLRQQERLLDSHQDTSLYPTLSSCSGCTSWGRQDYQSCLGIWNTLLAHGANPLAKDTQGHLAWFLVVTSSSTAVPSWRLHPVTVEYNLSLVYTMMHTSVGSGLFENIAP